MERQSLASEEGRQGSTLQERGGDRLYMWVRSSIAAEVMRRIHNVVLGGARGRVILAAFGGGAIDEGAAHHGGWYTAVLDVIAVLVAVADSRDRSAMPRPTSLGDRILIYFGLR